MGSIEARARRRADGDPEAPEDATRGLNIGVRGATSADPLFGGESTSHHNQPRRPLAMPRDLLPKEVARAGRYAIPGQMLGGRDAGGSGDCWRSKSA
jgi:hypothetical protein